MVSELRTIAYFNVLS